MKINYKTIHFKQGSISNYSTANLFCPTADTKSLKARLNRADELKTKKQLASYFAALRELLAV